MNVVLDILNAIPSYVWESLIAAAFLSPFMLGVKKWLNVNRELVMFLLVVLGAFVTAGIAYVKDNPTFAPWLVIPLQAAGTFMLSQGFYYSIVKPLRNHWRGLLAEAEELNESKRAAIVSPEQVPATQFK